MQKNMDPNNPNLKERQTIRGYSIQLSVPLVKINSHLYELEHIQTGARHIHISNQDRENTFAVAFKTVPRDSTGVAHILEHTVLCGSEKFAVRDPFFSMLKRSLSTFMNAFTASDWTMYPFATQNLKDYYNLMDVYLDSAFFPNLDELSFKQEGHRIEVEPEGEGPDDFNLVYKGVVYNEMKGAMSSPDQVMGRSLLNSLYPDTTYSNNSGGDPEVIPTLTYQDLIAFHQRHYHPSNAFFYTYGNLPLEDHLIFIEEKILQRFTRIDPKTRVPSQPRWKQPKNVLYTYPLDPGDDPQKKFQGCLAWLTADIKESFEVLILLVLEQILLGNSASPLRKALLESNLGSALSDGTGFDADNRDTYFCCGLKEVEKKSLPEIEKLVITVIKDLVRSGIDKEMIASAIHQIEFHRKEITNTPYPYGIKLLLVLAGSWFHGGNPERILKFDEDLDKLKAEIGEGNFLEKRLQDYFMDNPHRVLFTLAPDQEMARKQLQRTQKELADIKARISAAEKEKLIQDAQKLEKLQESKEDISVLPTLEISDIPPSVQCVLASEAYPRTEAICYDQPTSGIFYLAGAAGIASLPADLIPLVPFYCYAFSKMGTRKHDFATIAQKIDLYTGGLGISAHARRLFGGDASGKSLPFLAFNTKCLDRNLGNMFRLTSELILEPDFSNIARLKQILMEYRAGLETMVIHNGHRLAISLASRTFTPSNAFGEMWSGIHQLLTIKDLTKDLGDESLGSTAAKLALIANTLFKQANFRIALIGEASPLAKAVFMADTFLGELEPGSGAQFRSPDISMETGIPREGWTTSTAVSFVAQAFKVVPMEHPDAPQLAVLAKILRSMYLHREIREKGGAYGGFSLYNSENGLFCFGSYRDPHIKKTLDVYDGVSDFLATGEITNEDIKEAILQVCSEIDKPDPPGPAARKAFYRRIINLSDEARNTFKGKLLSVTRDTVLATAEEYFRRQLPAKGVAVISSKERLEEANRELAEKPLQLNRI
jgi:Zn-dependent M16 (insulinase) family peptidase